MIKHEEYKLYNKFHNPQAVLILDWLREKDDLIRFINLYKMACKMEYRFRKYYKIKNKSKNIEPMNEVIYINNFILNNTRMEIMMTIRNVILYKFFPIIYIKFNYNIYKNKWRYY